MTGKINMSFEKSIPVKWLITGGCGFIGTSLIAYLRNHQPEARIIVLDNFSVGTPADLGEVCDFNTSTNDNLDTDTVDTLFKASPVILVEGDIRNEDHCLTTSGNVDVIVHLAANTGVGPSVEDPRGDMVSNVVGTFNMLEAARQNQVKRFIFASSGAPAGEVEPPIHEELAPHPVSPYGASKLAGEGYCSAFYRSFGLETVCLRFGNVYGPGSGHKSSVVAKFIKKALSGKPLEIYGDGKQTRDFIYIEDLVRAILLVSSIPEASGETFQIATSREHTINEIVEIMIPILINAGVPDVKVIKAMPRIGDVFRNYSDTSKALSLLNWSASISLREGFEKTVKWFRDCCSPSALETKAG
jgi:UDP-glucose 4-epimerase